MRSTVTVTVIEGGGVEYTLVSGFTFVLELNRFSTKSSE